jgi:hypothetical protein
MAPEAQFWGHGETYWVGIAAIAQVLLVLAVGVPIWLSLREGRQSRQEFQRIEREKFYIQLDEMYLRILRIAVENPKLRDPALNSSESDRIAYDTYAFIIWNFLETIYDFSAADSDAHASIAETWQCIFDTERKAYAEWFNREENRGKFKRKFRDHIDGLSVDPKSGGATIAA